MTGGHVVGGSNPLAPKYSFSFVLFAVELKLIGQFWYDFAEENFLLAPK